MGIFGTAHGWEGTKRHPLLKISHTYLTIMKLGTVIPYLEKVYNINIVIVLLTSAFSPGNQQFLLYQEI